VRGRKVLLVNPWIHDFAAYDLWARPLGLLIVGSVVRRNGVEVSFIDCLGDDLASDRRPGGHGKFRRSTIEKPEPLGFVPRTYARYGIDPGEFARRLEEIPAPDAVLVTSMMTYWYPGVREAVGIVKDAFPGVPVILGGVYATLCTDHARLASGADYVVAGTGEARVIELLCSLWGCSAEYVPDEDDLDSLPYPAFDVMDNLDSVCVRTARGCPYRCAYCAAPVLSGSPSYRKTRAVIEEILHWERSRGVKDVAFVDDALLTPRPRALEFLGGLASKSGDVRFHCPNALHAREISSEVARLMREAGFVTVRLGLETADAFRQRATGGKVTNDEYLWAVDALVGAGYESRDIGVYVLCGLPDQEPEEVLDTVRFVLSSGATPLLAEYSPIPHTPLWDEAQKASPYPISDEPLFHNNTILPCAQRRFLEVFPEIKRLALTGRRASWTPCARDP